MDCHAGNPCDYQRDPTANDDLPIIERIREASNGRASMDFNWLINDKPELVDAHLSLSAFVKLRLNHGGIFTAMMWQIITFAALARQMITLAATGCIGTICFGVDLEPDEWIKDSGCSKHMIGNRKLFSTYKAYNGGYSQNSKAYIILNKHTRKIKESLNVTFDETPPPSKTSPLVDDDLDEEEAIREIEKEKPRKMMFEMKL
ncbi:hypothetical protein Tco_1327876 [Tanacetum coccineum]